MNPGFSDEERGKFTELLDAGFIDTFRSLYPDRTDAYSWWSYRAAARQRNVGWRIDYLSCPSACGIISRTHTSYPRSWARITVRWGWICYGEDR